jgi:glycosyltransferase involved in cell wall biosynthesis
VLAAWAALAGGGDWDLDLAVVGRGSEAAAWEERARAAGLGARCRFLGFRRDVPRLLAASDVLVAPTRYEAYGLGVQEALARGLPALVSAAAGVAERYPRELAALLVQDPNSAEELAARLRNWRAQAEALAPEVRALGARLRARTWDAMAAEILALAEVAT